jgi:nicotinamide N-methyltransferase
MRGSATLREASSTMIRRNWHGSYPTAYLQEYYDTLAPDERIAMSYLLNLMRRRALPGGSLLDFGCGPTVHRAIAVAPYVDTISFADLIPENLEAIRSWIEHRAQAHDWSSHTRYLLEMEGAKDPSQEEVRSREQLARGRVDRLVVADAYVGDPMGSADRHQFDVVMACFCLEVAAHDRESFRVVLRNVLTLVAENGLAVFMSLKNCPFYVIGGQSFDCYPVQEDDVVLAFQAAGFTRSVHVEARAVPEHQAQGYTEILLASARRDEASPLPGPQVR